MIFLSPLILQFYEVSELAWTGLRLKASRSSIHFSQRAVGQISSTFEVYHMINHIGKHDLWTSTSDNSTVIHERVHACVEFQAQVLHGVREFAIMVLCFQWKRAIF